VSDAKTLYRELILQHGRSNVHFGPLSGANAHATKHNPLCGDTIAIHLDVAEGRVRRASFEGHGCAVARAVASLLVERVTGRTTAEILAWAERVDAVTRGTDDLPFAELQGIRTLPARRRCATLPWEALAAALDPSPGLRRAGAEPGA